MPLEHWSEKVIVVHLSDDPQLTEDLVALEHASRTGPTDAVLDFSGVQFINSSNLAKLLKVRKQITANGGQLALCNVTDHVWGTLLITGLEKLFTLTDSVATALATVQMK